MKEFFEVSTEYGADGFALFGWQHLLYLAASAAFIACLCLGYRRTLPTRRRSSRRLVASAALVLELLRAVLLALNGQYGINRLPLHLCALAVYISFIHALSPKKLIGQFLYAFCMPGAVAALLFPDWGGYPALSFMSFCGFAQHSLIVGYTLMQTVAGDVVPDLKKAPVCFGIMLALAAPVYVFDICTDMNYMFLNWPSPGSPLEWFAFLGRPGYVLGYLPMIGAAWALMYYPFRKKSAD